MATNAIDPVNVATGEPEARAVAEIVRRHIAPQVVPFTGYGHGAGGALILPDGLKAHSLVPFIDEYLARPKRAKGEVQLTSLESFLEHVERFKLEPDSVVFANDGDAADRKSLPRPSLTAVHNYHSRDLTGWGDFRSTYQPPLSEEWAAWLGRNGAAMAMTQAEFAAWIEDHILDVAAPKKGPELSGLAAQFASSLGVEFAWPFKLVELSRGLSVRVDQRVKEAKNLATGEGQVQFIAEHQDEQGAPLKVPGAFLLAIPVFKHGPIYELPVRLRYRVNGGTIGWFFEVWRADKVFSHAWREICEQVSRESGLPVFRGFAPSKG